jgi:hypothetical protein
MVLVETHARGTLLDVLVKRHLIADLIRACLAMGSPTKKHQLSRDQKSQNAGLAGIPPACVGSVAHGGMRVYLHNGWGFVGTFFIT